MTSIRRLESSLLFGVVLVACSPLHDLDAVTKGLGDKPNAGAGSTLQGTAGSAGLQTTSSGSPAVVGGGSGGPGGGGSSNNAAGSGLATGGTSSQGGASGEGGTLGGAGGQGGTLLGGASGSHTTGGDAASLPIDLTNSPVTGTFTVSADASWEVDGTFVPTFEIHTPSANYWLVKSLGMLVSITDPGTKNPQQWIAYSSGFRPLRGFPSYGSFGTPEPMTTTLDVESQTPTHLRLTSQSAQWRLVWDFYPTHLTLTVNAAPPNFGIAYRGVPDGSLESSDRFVPEDAAAQSAQVSFVADLPGPAEWAYLSDTVTARSLFMVQHSDDAKVDRYQVKDNDSAMLSFGDGALQALPQRFSLGLIDSTDHPTVKARAAFVIGAIH